MSTAEILLILAGYAVISCISFCIVWIYKSSLERKIGNPLDLWEECCDRNEKRSIAGQIAGMIIIFPAGFVLYILAHTVMVGGAIVYLIYLLLKHSFTPHSTSE